MKDLAPDIVRQRCLVEGFASRKVVEADIRDYFKSVTGRLGLRAYGEPTIFSPGGIGKDGNQGFDAFIPLIDSGISLYYWASRDFVSIVIYTCKSFDEAVAVEATKEFFGFKEVEWQSF